MELTVRQMLDTYWEFADNLKPLHKWGIIASAAEVDEVLISYAYYVRYNDVLLFTINASKGWRQMDNLRNGRVFSFLIANTEVFDNEPLKYIRLFIRGKVTAIPVGSDEFEKLYSVYTTKNSIDPTPADHIGVLKPIKLAYGIKTMPKYKPEDTPLELSETNFDSDYRYIPDSANLYLDGLT